MNADELRRLFEALAAGETGIDEALAAVARSRGIEDLGFARLDVDRERRCGAPEVIFGSGKTDEQLAALIERSLHHHGKVLVTRVDAERAPTLVERFAEVEYDVLGRLLRTRVEEPWGLPLAVVSAGTSDLPVAEEAAATLEFLGHRVERITDVGVAGIHRLFEVLDRIEDAVGLAVVAGMEGALPSVVAGLVDRPIVAVPTSIGYGASLGGMAALLAMLNSCASGLSVVNIDNGFGAAMALDRIARAATRHAENG